MPSIPFPVFTYVFNVYEASPCINPWVLARVVSEEFSCFKPTIHIKVNVLEVHCFRGSKGSELLLAPEIQEREILIRPTFSLEPYMFSVQS